MSAVEVLKQEVAANIERLDTEILCTPFEDPRVYGDFLAQTYYFVLHSTRLLALASAHFPLNMNDFHYRYAEHVREERGHELMALRDLQNLGFELTQFPEYSETQAFYQTQYYQIEHVDPLAFWGYVFCLENFAVSGGVDIHRRTREKFGERSTLFLKVHVQEDTGHVEEAYQVLGHVSAVQAERITRNMKLACDLYSGIFRRINRTILSAATEAA